MTAGPEPDAPRSRRIASLPFGWRMVAWWSAIALVGLVLFASLGSSGDGDDGASAPRAAAEDEAAEGESDDETSDDGAGDAGETSSEGSTTSLAADPDNPSGAEVFDGQEYDDTSRNTITTQPPADGCDPGYAGACIPLPPARFTCADIPERGIIVTGADLQGLDPDFDGTACPSGLPPATTDPNAPPDEGD